MDGDSEEIDRTVAVLEVTEAAAPEKLNAYIQDQWDKLRADPDYARSIGVDVADLPERAPLEAVQHKAKFGVAETILIAVAGGLLKDAATGIWKQFIWPRLEKKFGGNLKQIDDEGG